MAISLSKHGGLGSVFPNCFSYRVLLGLSNDVGLWCHIAGPRQAMSSRGVGDTFVARGKPASSSEDGGREAERVGRSSLRTTRRPSSSSEDGGREAEIVRPKPSTYYSAVTARVVARTGAETPKSFDRSPLRTTRQ